ncbi:hypothetical protein ACIPLC_01990 [Kitasatospora sp. NPDC086801]|uniref:hypothetical protein n=1 Tax=Kitasatospora sp. NPDC086801 TaxID=3364066 RepID=UPI00381D4419
MFRATAPVRRPAPTGADGPHGTPGPAPAAVLPRLVRAGAHTPPGPGAPYRPEAAREDFYRELGALYGADFDREQFAASGRRTSVELAHGALDALGPLTAEECPEVVVVAYAAPDFDHAELVASCVKRRLPGEPLSFALSDQGVLAPFSALRVAVEYARRCGWSRLLLVVVDQGTQPFPLPATGQSAVHADAAVALLIHWDGDDAPLGGAAQGLPEPGLFADWDTSAALVAGSGLSDGCAELPTHGGPLTEVAAGQPATGSWTALLTAADRNRPAMVADYDRERGFLAYCTLDTGELGVR